ncbi:hypothetical protein E0Z10_g1913 [Xylaria hypoxylon]|uniref:Uncharacterized protein n=1 Tax=Xylaria hypoxylon TaxID=37992 RepID=A0A4Z0ZBH1_9PEZI|nr:hypothetical protein E0Z10_g1913 [Xylaria hypoxylon]
MYASGAQTTSSLRIGGRVLESRESHVSKRAEVVVRVQILGHGDKVEMSKVTDSPDFQNVTPKESFCVVTKPICAVTKLLRIVKKTFCIVNSNSNTGYLLHLNTIKTKKCFECQTSTAAATLKLIAAMTTAPNVDKLDPYMVKQASQLLFERVAGQRRKTDNGFKDDWSNIELAFATFCYHHIAPTQLSDLCHTVRTRFGAGVDRQLLKALVKAACRENGVWENIIDPTEPIVYVTLNTYIEKLRAETELIERFKDVQYMFKNAEDLGKLAIETVAVLREIDARLSR